MCFIKWYILDKIPYINLDIINYIKLLLLIIIDYDIIIINYKIKIFHIYTHTYINNNTQ